MSGGGSNRAANEANRAEQERQAAIRNTQGRVNQVFNDPSRAADIGDFVDATRTYYTDDLNKQKATNDRELTFALARGGLVGGSTQRDQQKTFAEDYSKGLLDVDRRALGAGAQLEAADQDARARLISLATSGLDTATAAQQSAAAMRSNLEAGKSTAMAQGLGDVFGGVKSFADKAKIGYDKRRGISDAYDNLYAPSTATGFYYGGAMR